MNKKYSRLSLFKYLSAEEMEKAKGYLLTKKFSQGEQILKQGEIGEGLYLIENGEASVTTHLPGNVKVILATLNEGNLFGEVSLLTTDPIAASVFAQTDLRCSFLSHEMLYSLHIVDPLFAHRLLKGLVEAMCERVRNSFKNIANLLTPEKNPSNLTENYKLKKQEVAKMLDPNDRLLSITFPEISPERFAQLFPYMTLIKAKKHTVIYQNKQEDASCYLLLQGAVQSVVENDSVHTKVSVFGPSHVFGQLEFIDEKERVYSTIVREDAVLLKMDLAQKLILKKMNPKLWCEFHFFLSKRLAKILRTTNIQLLRLQSELNHV